MRVKYINNRFLSLVGLCQKAGKIVSGSMQCESAVRSGKAFLVIMSREASDRTKDQFYHLCKSRNINMITAGTKEELGNAIGKESRTLLAVLDMAFKEMLLNEYQKSGTGVTVNGKN